MSDNGKGINVSGAIFLLRNVRSKHNLYCLLSFLCTGTIGLSYLLSEYLIMSCSSKSFVHFWTISILVGLSLSLLHGQTGGLSDTLILCFNTLVLVTA